MFSFEKLSSRSTPTVEPPASHRDAAPAGVDALERSGEPSAGGVGAPQPLDPGTRARTEPRFGYDFSKVRVHAEVAATPVQASGAVWPLSVQRKLAVGASNDRWEREAEATADAVVARLPASPDVPGTPDGTLQRACESCGEAADRLTEVDEEPRIMRRLALGPIDDPLEQEARRAAETIDTGGDEPDDALQLARATEGAPAELPASFARGLAAQESGGVGLAAPVRRRMEDAFGFDFGKVRIHAEAPAGDLASSIGSLAFTHHRHIFFAPDRYQAGTREGLHLLSHELAHVVQQGGCSEAPVRRRPDKAHAHKKPESADRRIGYVFLYDKSGKPFDKPIKVFDRSDGQIDLEEGVYRVEIVNVHGTSATLKLVGVNHASVPILDFGAAAQRQVKAAALLRLQIQRPAVKGAGSKTPEPPEKEGIYGEFDDDGQLFMPPDSPVTPIHVPDDAPGDPPKTPAPPKDPAPPPPEGQKTQQGKKDPAAETGEKKTEGTGDKGKDGEGSGTGNEPGSKYGWLGILKLPQELINALEAAFEAFGDADEWLALQETMRTLVELAERRDDLGKAFSDGEHLVEILLGLEPNSAFDALEAWATKDRPGHGKKTEGAKGLVAVALKIAHVIEKIRAVLKPVFATRAKLKKVVDGALDLLGGLTMIEDLMDAASDIEGEGTPKVKALIAAAAGELGGKINEKVTAIFSGLELQITTFAQADFFTYEEIAEAVTAAALKFIPYPYKLGVKAAQKVGLDTLAADHLVAPLIPKAALSGLNDVFRALAQTLTPSVQAAVRMVQDVAGNLTDDLSTELPGVLESAFAQASPRSTAAPPDTRALVHAERLVASSAGAPLAAPLRDDLEGQLGGTFADVQVHTDGAAATASDRLGANAFTLGSHVFFGAGAYDPDSAQGRRLLAHELTHVAQQAGAAAPFVVQGDWKSLRQRLIRRFGDRLRAEITAARTGPKEDLEKASQAREWVDRHLDKTVSESDLKNKAFSAVYSVLRRSQKVSIRRRLKFIGKVPGLTLDRAAAKGSKLGVLKLGLLARADAFNPANRARAKLRRSLGCTSSQEAHHIVPLELEGDDLPKLAAASKPPWNINNGKDNGVCMDNKVHSGSHSQNTTHMREELNKIYLIAPGDWNKLEKPFRALIARERAKLIRRTTRLE